MIAGINEILNENTALINLIGEDKIFPLVVPQATALPFLSTSLARVSPTEAKNETSGLDFPVVNVNVHAENYDDLEEVSEAVRTALDNIQSVTDTGYTFKKIWFSNSFDRPDLYTAERPHYVRSVQFNVIQKR